MTLTPENKKWIGIAAGGLATILIVKAILPKRDSSGNSNDPTGNGPTGSDPASFSAQNVANKLYNAMKNSGTNEDAIIAALTPVNQQQFYQVMLAFGKQSYNKTTGNQINFWPLTPLPLEPLQVWLYEELSSYYYGLLQTKYPLYL